ncbi:hypothetical protein COL26_10650 [Bacillus thuringiensis]|uniref:Uncharacterized protein n=1 Tax=Bacillus thuringiensis TaxID=1428 RepID=A0ABD6SF56_BACTU|nr:hypothetical protein [Bacillus thuringiensis]PER51448.1 hypothetical protein CN495_18905 [Bacillus thuringiensis]PEU83461.1 hypothetical protein CN411_23195 [Bacillus thuringiensis]PFI03300.1 hypothetical protein COI79_29310 [Bacillus thuringiensis]PFW43852.1 hypothetical protein COL26_10650 [Bacillus thuringiensis]PGY79066.1 hypothetical protein COE44_12835 [Bacillus thuringiensis]
MDIEWDKVLPSVIGAITGGTMSLLGSYFSAKRQANKEEKRREYEERRAEKIALTSVKNEIEFNYIRYTDYIDVMDHTGLSELDLSHNKIGLVLKTDKWEKHSDTIENIEGLSYIGKLRGLYMNVHRDLTFNIVQMEDVKGTTNQAYEIRKEIEDTLKNYS